MLNALVRESTLLLGEGDLAGVFSLLADVSYAEDILACRKWFFDSLPPSGR